MTVEPKTTPDDTDSLGTEYYGPYPFNPHTAFRNLVAPEVKVVPAEVIESGTECLFLNSYGSKIFDRKIANDDPTFAATRRSAEYPEVFTESLVGNSEVVGINYGSQLPNSIGEIGIGESGGSNGGNGSNDRGEYTSSIEGFESPDNEGISPLSRTGNSLRRLLSRSNASSRSRSSLQRNSSTGSISRRSSLRSPLSPSLSFSSRRWGSFRSRVSTGDLEEGRVAAGRGCVNIDAAELDGVSVNKVETSQQQIVNEGGSRRIWNPEMPPDRRMVEDLFGRALCSPQYHGLRRAYIAQIEKRLEKALYDSSVINPNLAVWPKPFKYLTGHLGIVSRRLKPAMSVTDFVLGYMREFTDMIWRGRLPIPGQEMSGEDETEKAAALFGLPQNDPYASERHHKLLHEWMLFSLETWMMLDISHSIEDRSNLLNSYTFCECSVQDLLKPHLPGNIFAPPQYSPAATVPTTIAPAEFTAAMLSEWKGFRFVWTSDITEHLHLDTQRKEIMLYSQVAYCHLHAIAKEDSSLHKAGFVTYHRLLVEISDTFRLLFGADRRSQILFSELSSTNTSGGFYNVFDLPSGDSEPRFLYNISSDFPAYGDRLLVLKSILKPTGIWGLWRDRRDSLQFYTFWALMVFGCFSIVMGFLQLGLSSLQAWAAVEQLRGTNIG